MRSEQGIANQKIAKANYKKRNREKLKADAKLYHVKNKEHRNEYNRTMYIKHPEKWLVWTKVKRALGKGILIKEPCIECGDENTNGHHNDYSEPLKVIWLCRSCHQIRHNRIINGY